MLPKNSFFQWEAVSWECLSMFQPQRSKYCLMVLLSTYSTNILVLDASKQNYEKAQCCKQVAFVGTLPINLARVSGNGILLFSRWWPGDYTIKYYSSPRSENHLI
jgi:hypothetical protein